MLSSPSLRAFLFLAVVLALSWDAGGASATPVSMCTGAPNHPVCDLYGSGIGTPVFVLGDVTPGVVDIYAFGGVQRTGQLLFGSWDGTSLFLNPTQVGGFVQLLRDGCASGSAGDQSCFFAKPFPGPDIIEDSSGLAVYSPPLSLYRVHPAPVPEPALVGLFVAGLACMAARSRKLTRLAPR